MSATLSGTPAGEQTSTCRNCTTPLKRVSTRGVPPAWLWLSVNFQDGVNARWKCPGRYVYGLAQPHQPQEQ